MHDVAVQARDLGRQDHQSPTLGSVHNSLSVATTSVRSHSSAHVDVASIESRPSAREVPLPPPSASENHSDAISQQDPYHDIIIAEHTAPSDIRAAQPPQPTYS